jgi:hypothetical protein
LSDHGQRHDDQIGRHPLRSTDGQLALKRRLTT